MIAPEVNSLKKLIRLLNVGHAQDFSRLWFGPIVEEGLLIGVSIATLLVVISIILAILDNTTSLFDQFTNNNWLG
jgi:hypothetical protein